MTDINVFLEQYPEIELFEVFMPDLNGKLRGKWIPRDNIGKVFNGSLKIPLSTQAFDIWGNDHEDFVMENGDADGICAAEERSLYPVPWLSRPTGQIMVSMRTPEGADSAIDTRALLSRLQQRLQDHGYTAVMAAEMEFHLLSGIDHRGRPIHGQQTPEGEVAAGGDTYGIDSMQTSAELMHAIRDAALAQELPVDTLIKESAPSQYEVNLYHRPDALLSADQGLMLQRVIRGVANAHGKKATFMAKPFADISGNGMHVHCSLLDSDGNNAFDDGTGAGTPFLRQAIAGCLATMAEFMLLLAPHANSYRRFTAGAHAPLSPTWGYENRTVALRVPADKPVATRIEHRVAGADASPYLVYAAILAGILHGLENELDCPEPLAGNAYDIPGPRLPSSWVDAHRAFSESEAAKTYLGTEFQRVYSLVKQQEIDRFATDISPFEYASYL
jgi:glutamine synthetase